MQPVGGVRAPVARRTQRSRAASTEGEDHRLGAFAGPTRPCRHGAEGLGQGGKLAGANRVSQGRLGGKEAIDVGARRAEPFGDVGDGGANAELAEQIPGDGEDVVAQLSRT